MTPQQFRNSVITGVKISRVRGYDLAKFVQGLINENNIGCTYSCKVQVDHLPERFYDIEVDFFGTHQWRRHTLNISEHRNRGLVISLFATSTAPQRVIINTEMYKKDDERMGFSVSEIASGLRALGKAGIAAALAGNELAEAIKALGQSMRETNKNDEST